MEDSVKIVAVIGVLLALVVSASGCIVVNQNPATSTATPTAQVTTSVSTSATSSAIPTLTPSDTPTATQAPAYVATPTPGVAAPTVATPTPGVAAPTVATPTSTPNVPATLTWDVAPATVSQNGTFLQFSATFSDMTQCLYPFWYIDGQQVSVASSSICVDPGGLTYSMFGANGLSIGTHTIECAFTGAGISTGVRTFQVVA
jgi:hypothetical protein